MPDLTNRIMKIKDEIDHAKSTKARIEGELDALHKRLKKEHGAKNVAEAKKMEKELIEEADLLETEIKEGLTKLEGLYE